MLRKFSNSRSVSDNIKLGVLTAFTAGMVNVASLILFFSFTSNITGHYAILAEEVAKGSWFQVIIVFLWIFLYFAGSFLSNFIVINGGRKSAYLTHAIPLILEILCILAVGFYGVLFYKETLKETEFLVALLLFAMGLQNGLTASISNFAVKTTHLTGLTTDLAIHISMFSKPEFRDKKNIRDKIKLLSSIAGAYLTGAIIAGTITYWFQFKVFFYIAFAMMFILLYDFAKIYIGVSLYKRRKLRSKRSDSVLAVENR